MQWRRIELRLLVLSVSFRPLGCWLLLISLVVKFCYTCALCASCNCQNRPSWAAFEGWQYKYSEFPPHSQYRSWRLCEAGPVITINWVPKATLGWVPEWKRVVVRNAPCCWWCCWCKRKLKHASVKRVVRRLPVCLLSFTEPLFLLHLSC